MSLNTIGYHSFTKYDSITRYIFVIKVYVYRFVLGSCVYINNKKNIYQLNNVCRIYAHEEKPNRLHFKKICIYIVFIVQFNYTGVNVNRGKNHVCFQYASNLKCNQLVNRNCIVCTTSFKHILGRSKHTFIAVFSKARLPIFFFFNFTFFHQAVFDEYFFKAQFMINAIFSHINV